jgi:hypothetical protein
VTLFYYVDQKKKKTIEVVYQERKEKLKPSVIFLLFADTVITALGRDVLQFHHSDVPGAVSL